MVTGASRRADLCCFPHADRGFAKHSIGLFREHFRTASSDGAGDPTRSNAFDQTAYERFKLYTGFRWRV
jgi:hypothetical protein